MVRLLSYEGANLPSNAFELDIRDRRTVRRPEVSAPKLAKRIAHRTERPTRHRSTASATGYHLVTPRRGHRLPSVAEPP